MSLPILIVYGLHVLVCLALILIVLLQTGKGSDMGSAFGGASSTMFGSTGRQTFLSKLTVGAAVVFMLTCLFLAWYSSKTTAQGVMKDYQEESSAPAGATSGAAGLPGGSPSGTGVTATPTEPGAAQPGAAMPGEAAPETAPGAGTPPPATMELNPTAPPATPTPAPAPAPAPAAEDKKP